MPIYSYIIILSLAVIAMIFGTEESIRGLIWNYIILINIMSLREVRDDVPD